MWCFVFFFVSGSTWEVAAVWVLALEVEGNFSPVGVDWFSFYFLFAGLLCFSVPCHWVRWLQRLGQSNDIQAPLRPGSITCHLGRCRATVPTDLIKTQASCGLEALNWARDHMSRSVQSSAKLSFQSKRLKIRDHLDAMFGSFSVTLPLQGGHCSLQPSPGWLETGPGRAGKSVAKNMNSFHSLGVRGRHPDLASWLQTSQQNGLLLDGSPSYLFFLSQEIILSKGTRIRIVKKLFHAIVCIIIHYPFNNPMKHRYFDYLCWNEWRYNEIKWLVQGREAT